MKTIEKAEPLSLLHMSSGSSEPKPELSAGTVGMLYRNIHLCQKKQTDMQSLCEEILWQSLSLPPVFVG